MFKIIGLILFDQKADTLAMTRKVGGTSATAAAMNTNMTEIEAVINGHIDADNLEDDGVTAAKLNSDVVRADYGLKQHTDGSLMVDPSDTNPCIEQGDGGIRVKVDSSSIERASGGLQVKAGGITVTMLASAVLNTLLPVGIVVTFGVATNPATLFGVGTWTAIQGRVIVGIDGTTEFATLDQTGGEKTHTMTLAELVAHTHTMTFNKTGGAGAGATPESLAQNATPSSINTGSAGSTTPFNVLQPYIVKYVWQRTA